MSIVYVVQNQQKRHESTGLMGPKFDLSSARDYGELVYLLDSHDLPFRPVPVVDKLRAGLASFTEKDYLLLIGNPCLIGWSVAIASQATGGVVRVLQWHKRSSSYILIESNLSNLQTG